MDTKDRDRHQILKDHFHKDPADPQYYDLIINRSRFSVDETADLVIEALQRMQAENGREGRRVTHKRSGLDDWVPDPCYAIAIT